MITRDAVHLIKMWLQAPVEERDGDGTRRMSGGKNSKRGTPQGGKRPRVACDVLRGRATIARDDEVDEPSGRHTDGSAKALKRIAEP